MTGLAVRSRASVAGFRFWHVSDCILDGQDIGKLCFIWSVNEFIWLEDEMGCFFEIFQMKKLVLIG